MMVQRTGRAKSLKLELLMASAYVFPELKKEALQPRATSGYKLQRVDRAIGS